MIQEAQLERGIIFGDRHTGEYVYMPGSEVGADHPVYVYEQENERRDILIRVRDLRPTEHPLLGQMSC